ncbi:MAG: ABC transporter permease [Terracidiphilus sp.]
MTWIPSYFRRRRIYDDLSEEIRLHVEERTEQLMGEGMSRKEAERQARRAFGNRTLLEERSREVWQWPTMESIVGDVRLALRQLRKSPGFTIAAVLTLALAIGANAVVFGVLNALILRPLNVPDPQSLYTIERGPYKAENNSYPDYVDLRDRNRSFEAIMLYNIVSAGLDTGNNPSEIWGYEVSGNYFDALHIQPYLGRVFHGADEHGPDSAPYLVLSHAYWHSHFNDDRGVVGRVVQVNKHPYTILGVAQPAFQGTLLFFTPDFWMPIVNQDQVDGWAALNERGQQNFIMTLGHVKPGVTAAQAVADLNSVGTYLEKTYPKDDANMTFTLARPSLAGDLVGPAARGFLTGVMLLAGLILLAACANLGSLFAARAADRSREVALRLALGSSRKRILRQVFTEAVLISLVGGTLGLLGSVALLRALSTWRPIPMFPISVPVSPDANVYWFALLLALASGFLFGAVPVRQVLRTNPYEVVKAGSSGIVAGNTGRRITLRDALVVVQIAICAVLVTSSLVAVRGLIQSTHSKFGFEPKNTILVNTNLAMANYAGDRATAMQKRMIETLETMPGVRSVGFVQVVPLGGAGDSESVFADQTTDLKPSNQAAYPSVFKISPEYFHAAGTTLLRGRGLSWRDDKNSPRVAVVNQEFARKLFGSETSSLGGYFKLEDGSRVQVVGIAEDGKYWQMTEDLRPAIFLSFLQSSSLRTNLVIRSDGDPGQLAGAIRSRLRSLDSALPLDIETWIRYMDLALFPSHIATVALGVLGLMGAMLSITGIFGMAAYSVSKRLRELGIRMALGAQRTEVLKAALGRAVKLLALGSAAGLLLGVLAAKVLAYIVYQANPRDPLVLAGVVVAMALLGLLATWVPAQRALSVDPLILLREE